MVLVLVSALLFVGPLIDNPEWGYLFALAVLVLGFLIWLIFIRFAVTIPLGKYLHKGTYPSQGLIITIFDLFYDEVKLGHFVRVAGDTSKQ